MITLTARRIRAELDASSFGNFKDRSTAATPKHWRGNPLRIEIGVFYAQGNNAPTDAQIVDLSIFASLTVEVRTKADDIANVMAATVAAADFTSMEAATWIAGTSQQAVVEFLGSETNIAKGTKHIAISGILLAGGDPITLGASSLEIVEDGAGSDATAPAANPGAAISLGEADARYLRSGLTGTYLIADTNGTDTYALTITDGVLGIELQP